MSHVKHSNHQPLGTDVGHVRVIASTDRALLCQWDDGEEAWVPRSAIDDESEVGRRGDRGVLVVTRWIAEKLERVDRHGYTTSPGTGKKPRRTA